MNRRQLDFDTAQDTQWYSRSSSLEDTIAHHRCIPAHQRHTLTQSPSLDNCFQPEREKQWHSRVEIQQQRQEKNTLSLHRSCSTLDHQIHMIRTSLRTLMIGMARMQADIAGGPCLSQMNQPKEAKEYYESRLHNTIGALAKEESVMEICHPRR